VRIPTKQEIIDLDDDLAAEGVALDDRANQALQRWLKRTQWSGEFLPIAKHFDEQFKLLHPSVKLEGRPFMFLCASARGVAYEYHPPLLLGQCSISPTDSLQISSTELERIYKSNAAAYWELFWQCCDCFDLFTAHMDNAITDTEAIGFATAAKDQLQASARQLVAMSADASLAQACAMATELAGKALLKQLRFADVRSFGHDVPSIYREIVERAPAPTDDQVPPAAAHIPSYVSSRYSPPILATLEAQRLFAAALFLCSDAFRRISRQSMYFAANQDATVPRRQW